MSMIPLVFCDCETTGLNPFLHEPWEVGVIFVVEGMDPVEKRWLLPVDHLEWSEPAALKIGGFLQRHDRDKLTDPGLFAHEFMQMTRDAIIVGVNPTFDIQMLTHYLFQHGGVPTWHYQPVCLSNLIAGKFGKPPPWRSHELSRLVGVNPDAFDRHSALGDCRWTKAMYDALYGDPS